MEEVVADEENAEDPTAHLPLQLVLNQDITITLEANNVVRAQSLTLNVQHANAVINIEIIVDTIVFRHSGEERVKRNAPLGIF